MNDAITIVRESDLSGLRLEQTCNGHCASPWFSFDWRGEGIRGPADIRSRYHQIIRASVEAFSQLLVIRPDDVLVAQRNDSTNDTYWWRLSTRFPHALPKTKKPELPENRGAIEI